MKPQTSVFNPIRRVLDDLIERAYSLGASDLHIEPEASLKFPKVDDDGMNPSPGVIARARINGELKTITSFPYFSKNALIFECKRFVRADLSLFLVPQDTRVSIPELGLDIRASLIPTLNGEKFVLRFLPKDRDFQLSAQGLSDELSTAVQKALKLEQGLILVTGPTGSGKSTLLYSCLKSLDLAGLNVVTIEDPIEYEMPGVTQIQVQKRMGFGDALRSLLRQDPDVIFVGEIRDAETARLCFEAADTGHLVLSTLHTKSVNETSARLKALGIEEDQVASHLRLTIAQRLLPVLCAHCSLPGENGFYMNPLGCESCRHLSPGISGRLAVREYGEMGLPPSTPLKEAVYIASQKGIIDANYCDAF